MADLTQTSITFGKYKDLSLSHLLRDRGYCNWLLKQTWFQEQYEYLYNRVKEYDPIIFFLEKPKITEEKVDVLFFLDNYHMFFIKENPDVPLTEVEQKCYAFYKNMLKNIRDKLVDKINDENPFDIKAPVNWLKKFETDTGMSRDIFKEFLSAYGLPGITTIIEEIKKKGGIEYKGGKSFLIAKSRSLEQEKYWEIILKKIYGEDIGCQFKYKNCIFDFIDIKRQILYECKLGLKDFNEEQYKKYLLVASPFAIVYLIGNDCVVNTRDKILYTTDLVKYGDYILTVNTMPTRKQSKFDNLLLTFKMEKVESLEGFL
jgi:hypothetical protein